MTQAHKSLNLSKRLLIMTLSPSLLVSQAFAAGPQCEALFFQVPSVQKNMVSTPPLRAQVPSPFGQHSALGALKIEAASNIYFRRVNYAGMQAKKTDVDGNPIDWLGLEKNLASKIKNNVYTYADYDLAIAQYYMKGNDAHTSTNLNSTLIKTSPFQLTPVDADSPGGLKFAINFIDTSFTPTQKNVRTPEPGDHVLAINGKPVDEFRRQKNTSGDYILPQTLLVGKETTAQYIFGLSSRNAKESRGNLLSELGESITYTIQPKNGAPYDITFMYKVTGTALLRQPVRPDAPPLSFAQKPMLVVPPKETAVAAANRQQGFTERLSGFLKDVKSTLSSRIRARNPLQLPPLRSESKNAGTYKIFQKASALMHAGVDQIKKEGGPTQTVGTGTELGMGLQKPFVNFEALGKNAKRIQMPDDSKLPGLRSLFNDDFFYAATYEHDGVRIGVLRIPSYEPTNTQTMLQSLRYFITRLQAESDVLIIDQTYNPGGLVLFSDMVIRSLVGKYDTSKHLAFAVKPSPRFLSEYSGVLEEVRANTDQLLQASEARDFVVRLTDEYNKIRLAARLNKIDYDGNEIAGTALAATADILPLSEPITMTVVSDYVQLTTDRILQSQSEQKAIYDKIQKVTGIDLTRDTATSFYTKKVIFWTNAPCFSGGDATPVSFAGYRRGPIVGDSTAGAGGTVEAFASTGLRDNNVKFTSSLMIRAGFSTAQLLATGAGQVEQVGAPVDFKIMPTTNDIVTGGADSFAKISNYAAQYAQSHQK